MRRRAKPETPGTVTVVAQGSDYRGSCNLCGWVGRRRWGNMKSAQQANQTHRTTCPGVSTP